MFNNIFSQITIKVSFPDIFIFITIIGSIILIYTVLKNDYKMESKKTPSYNWKDVIWIITLVVGMSGSYFGMKAKVDNLEKLVTYNSKMLNDNNLELIKYKIDDLQESQNDFKITFDKFIDDYYRSNR